MRIQAFTVGMLATNCYVVYDDSSREASVIDPGGDGERLLEFIESHGLTLKNIFLTHGHFDHILAAPFLRDKTGARIVIHSSDAGLTNKSGQNMYLSIARDPFRPFKADVMISGGERTRLPGVEAYFMHTPGHTPGSVCIVLDNVIFSGDTLFKNDCGRTDLEGGSEEAMRDSLRSLFMLDHDFIVYPGHGKPTTLFAEKQNNPYLRAAGMGNKGGIPL